jgi:hypothetical protein
MPELKKGVMKYVWRIQQVGALGSIIMLAMTIALILYPYVQWRFVELGVPREWDWFIVILLWSLVVLIVMIGGFTYDVMFRMWVPQQRVAVERNPFAKNLMTPKECINWQYCWIPMLKKLGLKDEAKFMLKWNEHMMNEDPLFRREVYKAIKWVQNYNLPPPDKRYLPEDLITLEFDPKPLQIAAQKYAKHHKNLRTGLELK